MLIVSRKTQDHTHHTPAKLALLHSLSSNTLYTLPLASPTPLSPLQNCDKLWFLCGRRSLWCHHAVLCVKQTSLNGAHSAANLENPAKYGVDGSTACRLDSIRATPAQIFRARHHRVRSAEMELSWIIAHEQELNSPQRLRFCSVLWSWSWFVCSRAPGKRSGDQICSDFRFWGNFCVELLGADVKGFLPLNRRSCCRMCLPVRRVVASYVTGAVTARSWTFQLLRPAVLRSRRRAGWELRSENSSKLSHLSFWLNGDLMAYSWWQIRASLNGGGGYWAMN